MIFLIDSQRLNNGIGNLTNWSLLLEFSHQLSLLVPNNENNSNFIIAKQIDINKQILTWITRITPNAGIWKAQSYGVLRIFIVFYHVSFDISTTIDSTACQTYPILTNVTTFFAFCCGVYLDIFI